VRASTTQATTGHDSSRAHQATTPEQLGLIKVRLLSYVLLACTCIAATAYWAPWVGHPTAALTLSGQDMGEIVKFLPAMQPDPLRVWREVFYLPPLLSALSLVLLASNASMPYPRWVRLGALLIAPLVLGGLLPPAWGHPRDLLSAEFRLQGMAYAAGLLAVLVHGLFRHLEVRPLTLTVSIVSVAAIGPGQWAFWGCLPRLWEAYGSPTVSLGWGIWLEIGAWLAVGLSGAMLWRIARP
jgi:hypothetical protein